MPRTGVEEGGALSGIGEGLAGLVFRLFLT